jgi:serine/threonine protein kinase
MGSGGFGKTFEVKEGNSSKVLKVLINNAPKAVELFQREAEVLSQLNHPGIPKVESNGYFAFYPKGSQVPVHCLVMEKVDGDNLRNYIKGRGRPIDGALAIRWLTELALILQQVHARGILHRDIKPENIIVKPDGKLVLIDFGAVREGTGTEVATQAVKGSTGTEVVTHMAGQGTSIFTAGYAAPEQIEGYALPQSDFYSLGCTFIFLLTAKEPNDGAMYDAYNQTRRWQEYSTGVSPQLGDLINRMILSSPRERPADVEAILQQLPKTNLQPESTSDLEDLNLTLELPLTPDEMQNGVQKRVELDSGAITVTVPAGVNIGKLIRVQSKGRFNLTTQKHGDLLLGA